MAYANPNLPIKNNFKSEGRQSGNAPLMQPATAQTPEFLTLINI